MGAPRSWIENLIEKLWPTPDPDQAKVDAAQPFVDWARADRDRKLADWDSYVRSEHAKQTAQAQSPPDAGQPDPPRPPPPQFHMWGPDGDVAPAPGVTTEKPTIYMPPKGVGISPSGEADPMPRMVVPGMRPIDPTHEIDRDPDYEDAAKRYADQDPDVPGPVSGIQSPLQWLASQSLGALPPTSPKPVPKPKSVRPADKPTPPAPIPDLTEADPIPSDAVLPPARTYEPPAIDWQARADEARQQAATLRLASGLSRARNQLGSAFARTPLDSSSTKALEAQAAEPEKRLSEDQALDVLARKGAADQELKDPGSKTNRQAQDNVLKTMPGAVQAMGGEAALRKMTKPQIDSVLKLQGDEQKSGLEKDKAKLESDKFGETQRMDQDTIRHRGVEEAQNWAKIGLEGKKADKEDLDKDLEKFRKATDPWTATGGALADAAKRYQGAERLEGLGNDYMGKPNDLDSRQMHELATGLQALIASSGRPAAGLVEKYVPDTVRNDWTKLEEWLTNERQGLGQQNFVKTMMETVAREKKISRGQVERAQQNGARYFPGLSAKHPDKVKEILGATFGDAGASAPTGELSEADALQWALKNRKNPKALDVFRALGLKVDQ